MNISENLLKLSDFPFSYSFIGGLFPILAGTSINFNDILTSEFAPLLAIMGLLGTALAISDPFGRLVKRIGIFLTKSDLPRSELVPAQWMDPAVQEMIKRFRYRKMLRPSEKDIPREMLRPHERFIILLREMFKPRENLMRPLSRDEDRELRSVQLRIQRKMIDTEEELNNISRRIDDIKKENEADEGLETISLHRAGIADLEKKKKNLEETLDAYREQVDALVTLKYNFDVDVIGKRSVETTWIRTEIDKIVGIFYFAIILSLFTVGIFFNSTLLSNSIHATLNSSALNDSSPISRDAASKLVMGLQFIFATVAGFIIVAIFFTIQTLRRRIKTVSIYMTATGRESQDLKEYIEKVLKYLSDKEWEMAELWARKLEDKF